MKSIIYDYIHRWRHTRGYGVHSPLAFRMIKECIYPNSNYAYYADSYIDYFFRNEKSTCQNLRMLIRLINVLHLSSIWWPDCPKKVKEIISGSFPKLRIFTNRKFSGNTDFIVISGKDDPGGHWNLFDGNCNACMLVYDNVGINSLDRTTLTLQSRRFSLFLRREGMHPVAYSIL